MKAVVLLSGGIDSPVALYLIAKKADQIVAVHMQLNDDKTNKIGKIKKKLEAITSKKIKLYTIKYNNIQKEFSENCNQKFLCILCKRTMLRIAEQIAKKEKADFIVTGENLSQVASQTLDNLVVNTNAVKIPIIRPLLCNDKQETIEIAKKTGIYETAILPGIFCSALPKNPATKSTTKVIEKEEQKINIKEMISQSLKKAEIIE